MIDLAGGTPDVPRRFDRRLGDHGVGCGTLPGVDLEAHPRVAVALEPLEVERVQRRGSSAGVDLGLEVADAPLG